MSHSLTYLSSTVFKLSIGCRILQSQQLMDVLNLASSVTWSVSFLFRRMNKELFYLCLADKLDYLECCMILCCPELSLPFVPSLCHSLGRSWASDLNHWIPEFVPSSSAPFLNRIFDWIGYMSIPLEETSRKLIFGQILSLITRICFTLPNYKGKKVIYVTIFSKIQLTTRQARWYKKSTYNSGCLLFWLY